MLNFVKSASFVSVLTLLLSTFNSLTSLAQENIPPQVFTGCSGGVETEIIKNSFVLRERNCHISLVYTIFKNDQNLGQIKFLKHVVPQSKIDKLRVSWNLKEDLVLYIIGRPPIVLLPGEERQLELEGSEFSKWYLEKPR